MAKRTDVKKVLIIGSGPIVIGQAAEFDYAGTQACLALKEEGYEVVLCNSNPATIMTDTSIADKVYMEPLTLEALIEKMAIAPRARFGIPLGEGEWTEWDLEARYRIAPEAFLSMGRATPFAGSEVWGRCLRTAHGGRIVWEEPGRV